MCYESGHNLKERSCVPALAVKRGPTLAAKGAQASNVGEESGGLCVVDPIKLALEAGNNVEGKVAIDFSQAIQLPYACWGPILGSP